MSNYLRKLGVFHTPPLRVPEDASLTGYVINTNGLKPVRINGDKAFDQGCLCSKMNVLQDTVMELGIDVLHITETHDSREKLGGGTPKKHLNFHLIADIEMWSAPTLHWNFAKEGKLGYFKKIVANRSGKNVHVIYLAQVFFSLTHL